MTTTTTERSKFAQRLPLPDLVHQIATDGVELARAEMTVARIRLAPRLNLVKIGMGLIVGAVIVALLAVIGFVVGLVLALASVFGPVLAAAIFVGGGFVLAALMIWIGKRQLSASVAALPEKLS